MLKKLLLLSTLLLSLLTVQAQTWYFEDFESLDIINKTTPEGWDVPKVGYNPAFQLNMNNGVDGSQAFYAQLQNAEERYFITQELNLGDEPSIEFQYKTTGIIGAPPANCLSLEISLIVGENTTAVKTVSAEDFVASSTYATMRVALDKNTYAGTQAKVKVNVQRAGSDNSSFYIDNFCVGTKPESVANDLMVQGELAGPTMPTVNTEAEYTFTVFNNGTASQAAYGVQLLNGARTLLASENITTAIEAGAKIEHTLKYTPTQAGADKLYAVVVLTGDEDRTNDTAALAIDVQAAGSIVMEVGQGKDLTYTPFAFTSQTSATLTLYSPEDLDLLNGTISALMYEGKFTEEITCTTQIYMGETDEESIPWDPDTYVFHFIDPSNFTKVFDAETTFPEGDHQNVRFTLTQPFAYSGSKTLAVYTFTRVAEGDVLEQWDANRFYATSAMGGATMVLNTSGKNINPMKPNGGSPVFQRPNTKFFFSSVSDEKYDLTFAVKDASGKAISDAVITLNGEKQEAGQYVFEALPARLYNYMVEKEGFVPAQGTLRLTADLTQDVTLINMDEYPGLTGYLFEDFENIAQNKRPLNWTGDFYVDEEGGQDDGRRLTHSFWFMDGPRSITTNPVFMGSDPVFEFEYRVMEFEESIYNYTGDAFAGENMTWSVEVTKDFGKTWEVLYSEDFGEHTPSTDYKPFSLDVSAYAGKICQFVINVNRDYGMPDKFFFDIDNIKIGTQVENDLALVSKIEGVRVPEAGVKTAYTVCVRNEGSAAAENYSLKFYDGETELGSVAGTKLESGAFAKLAFEYTFAEAGEHTLTAKCVMEADEFLANNTTTEFYVSVQPEGIQSSMVEAYEGEDINWYAPLNVYSNYTLNWLLYNQKDLAFEADNNISGMAFCSKFEQATDRMHLIIYMGETLSNSLFQGVPAPASLTKVFDGVASVGDLDGGNFIIEFQRAYHYAGKNIVVAVYTEFPQPFGYDVECGFYGYYSLDAVSVINYQSEEPIDPSTTLSQEELQVRASFCKPSTLFLLRDDISYHAVNFEVTDQNGQAVKNATVTFDGQTLKAGNYKVENVPDGTYAYSVSLGSETVGGSVTVNGVDVTEKVQLQHVANENLKENMIRIYPNPTTDKLHIDVVDGAKEINLYDISGRPVRKLNRVPAGVIEMDLSDCHNGIYLLMIDGKAFKISKR